MIQITDRDGNIIAGTKRLLEGKNVATRDWSYRIQNSIIEPLRRNSR